MIGTRSRYCKTVKRDIFFPIFLLITIIIYYIFFDTEINQSSAPSIIPENPIAIITKEPVWPYFIYIGMLVILAITYLVDLLKKKDIEYSAVTIEIMVMLFPFLPLFTADYWINLLICNGTFIIVAIFTFGTLSKDNKWMSFPLSIASMLLSLISMLIYAAIYVVF